jgi:hypothetical protein
MPLRLHQHAPRLPAAILLSVAAWNVTRAFAAGQPQRDYRTPVVLPLGGLGAARDGVIRLAPGSHLHNRPSEVSVGHSRHVNAVALGP